MVFDDLINGFDRALRTVSGVTPGQGRPSPAAGTVDTGLEASEQAHAAGLMRVNHTGEICAQALYDGQAMTARDEATKAKMRQAAQEEGDHLAWCADRLDELDSRPSVLNPLFYAGSFALGAAAGLLGDRVSLGFVEATESQVCEHLDEHLALLPEDDERSRAVLTQMREDESRHGDEALAAGGAEFPAPVKQGMRLVSRVMTALTYRV